MISACTGGFQTPERKQSSVIIDIIHTFQHAEIIAIVLYV